MPSTNNVIVSAALLVALVLTVACGSTADAPLPTSTALPATGAPTAEPTPLPPRPDQSALLTAHPWQWVAFTSPIEQYTIDYPQDYLLTFNSDGTVNIKTDCNSAGGTYTVDGSSLTIEVGPMTLVACSEDSRSDELIKYLEFTVDYFFQADNLFIDLYADGGTLEFAPARVAAGPPTQSSDTAALVETLGNLSYTGIFPDQPITLIDGFYYYEDGSSAKSFVRLIGHGIALGDLNGDGAQDAIVLLEDQSSGTGRFVYLAAVLDALGNATPTDALMIGDRIAVKSLAIDRLQVIADLIAQGPGDPACCPGWNVRKLFALQDDRLVEHSSENLSKVSLDDLNGTSWRLVDLNSLDQEPPLPGTEITLQIAGDQISGFAGCNQYNSTVTSQANSPQALTVGPIVTTRKLCHEPVLDQETTYLARLGKVVAWWYDTGRLALTYDLGEGDVGNLQFEVASTAGNK